MSSIWKVFQYIFIEIVHVLGVRTLLYLLKLQCVFYAIIVLIFKKQIINLISSSFRMQHLNMLLAQIEIIRSTSSLTAK